MNKNQALMKARGLAKNGQNHEAILLCEKVLSVFPRDPEAKKLLMKFARLQASGLSGALDKTDLIARLYSEKKYDQLIKEFEENQGELTGREDLVILYGSAHEKQSNFTKAADQYLQILRKNPQNATAWNNLANCQASTGDVEAAQNSYQKALEFAPKNPHVYFNVANLYRKNGRLDAATEYYIKCLNIEPKHAQAHLNLGIAYADSNNYAKAEESYRSAIEHFNPQNPDPFYNLALLYQEIGNVDLAIENYMLSLQVDASFAKSYRGITQLDKFQASEEWLKQLLDVYRRCKKEGLDEAEIGFAIYYCCKKLGHYKRGLHYLLQANSNVRSRQPYSIKQEKRGFEFFKSASDQVSRIPDLNFKKNKKTPVFIVGVPRSGTTLIERVLTAHSQIFGCGELNHMKNLCDQHIRQGCSMAEAIHAIRLEYYHRAAPLQGKEKFFTDKMPTNFLFLPLMSCAFPEAKFVHVYRTPAATIWSNFERHFPIGGLDYSYDLNDMVSYYELYRNSMSSYSKMMGEKIFHLDYDQFVQDPRRLTELLFKYMGISVEEAVYSPHEVAQSVLTASHEQVRRPIYKGSSNNWEVFEEFLPVNLRGIETFSTS